jgi:YesN/AraC family two-component response regulator
MMMPKMDGNELVRILKSNEKTSHIPIILLTARFGQEDKIEGLQTGADDYLTKPFDLKELHSRIENLIRVRKQLQTKFSKLEYLVIADAKKGKSLDEEFIIKVMDIIEKHISEEEFSIEEFGNEVGMSRTQFHRKFKAITGKPASMFLRSVRLSKAKKMIEEQRRNISEIAYSVGFSSPSYFSKCFREEFGYPPSDLIN